MLTLFDDDEIEWLYRGVPYESDERIDVIETGTIQPPRPFIVGEDARWRHMLGYTDTGYTSWSTDYWIAVDFAEFCSRENSLSGRTVVFRVSFTSVFDRSYEGRAAEGEYLIEGTIEDIEIYEEGS